MKLSAISKITLFTFLMFTISGQSQDHYTNVEIFNKIKKSLSMMN